MKTHMAKMLAFGKFVSYNLSVNEFNRLKIFMLSDLDVFGIKSSFFSYYE